MIEISYDEEVGILYLKLSDKNIKRTVEVEENILLLDVDKDDQVVGVEMLDLELALQYLGQTIQKYGIDKTRIKEELQRIQSIESVLA